MGAPKKTRRQRHPAGDLDPNWSMRPYLCHPMSLSHAIMPAARSEAERHHRDTTKAFRLDLHAHFGCNQTD